MWRVGALLLGLLVGSFANVCIHRLPRRQSVISPASRCPGCGAAIRAWQNIPVLSWLALRGRCAACGQSIAWRYPAVEVSNGLLYLALAGSFPPGLNAIVAMALATSLLVLALIDLDHQILPDVITLPGIVLGLAASTLPGPPTPSVAFGAAIGGFLGFAAVAKLYQKARDVEGLGQGDWKMAAMLGAFFGWQKLLLCVFLATLAGTLVGLGMILIGGQSSRLALPLGTFLGIAAIAVLFVGDSLLAWYGGFF